MSCLMLRDEFDKFFCVAKYTKRLSSSDNLYLFYSLYLNLKSFQGLLSCFQHSAWPCRFRWPRWSLFRLCK